MMSSFDEEDITISVAEIDCHLQKEKSMPLPKMPSKRASKLDLSQEPKAVLRKKQRHR